MSSIDKAWGFELSSNNSRAKLLENLHRGIVRTREKLPTQMDTGYIYFEIKITSEGDAGGVYIGLTATSMDPTVEISRLCDSYWYSSDGTVYNNGWIPFGPKFEVSDIIGCGIEKRSERSPWDDDGPKYRLFFTLNGQNLGTSVDVEKDDLKNKGLFPSVYCTGHGWEIESNFGLYPLFFDLRFHDKNIALSCDKKSKNVKVSGR